MSKIIELDRTIIPACDVPFEIYQRALEASEGIEKVRAVKTGVAFLDIGLTTVVKVAHDVGKLVIYDHQKAGTDIPQSSPDDFMDAMVRAKVDAVILFPQAGPVTQYEWTKAAQDRDIPVIVGGEMTHPGYLEGGIIPDKYVNIFSEMGMQSQVRGYIRDSAPEDMYELAARMGVTDFVVPGNKPDRIKAFKSLVEECGAEDPAFYSPGLVVQGGNLSEGADAAGKRFHGIVGRGYLGDIKETGRYNTKDEMRTAALELTSKL